MMLATRMAGISYPESEPFYYKEELLNFSPRFLEDHFPPSVMSRGFVAPRASTPEDPLLVVVLISGSGSGLAALLRHQQISGCAHKTVLVISDKPEAGGLTHASNYDVHNMSLPLSEELSGLERRLEQESRVLDAISKSGAELVVLSGYMRILTSDFVSRWKGRLINIHPSLLPLFPGAHAHRDVLKAGEDNSGCTVHLVDEGVDSGPILAQQIVPVHEGDTEDSLGARVRKAEHALYPAVLDQFCSDPLSFEIGWSVEVG